MMQSGRQKVKGRKTLWRKFLQIVSSAGWSPPLRYGASRSH